MLCNSGSRICSFPQVLKSCIVSFSSSFSCFRSLTALTASLSAAVRSCFHCKLPVKHQTAFSIEKLSSKALVLVISIIANVNWILDKILYFWNLEILVVCFFYLIKSADLWFCFVFFNRCDFHNKSKSLRSDAFKATL